MIFFQKCFWGVKYKNNIKLKNKFCGVVGRWGGGGRGTPPDYFFSSKNSPGVLKR